MGQKIKILLLNKWWAFTLGHYFLFALKRNNSVEVRTCGQFSGSYIPWNIPNNKIPERYVYIPDYVLPYPLNSEAVDYEVVESLMGDWKPDLALTTSSTCRWREKPKSVMSAAIAIDPHSLNYEPVRKVSDVFFNMQKVYSVSGDEYLPYAYDPTFHYEEEVGKIYDVAVIGLMYPHRVAVIERLKSMGLSVYSSLGLVYDEYRKAFSQSKVVFNWSSLDDLNARAFESPMMGMPVMNRVTDMREFPAFDDVRTFYCDNNAKDKTAFVPNAVKAIMDVLDSYKEYRKVILGVREKLASETYDARISQILKFCGFV